MPSIPLQNQEIQYRFEVNNQLKSFRISVENDGIVVIKGREIPASFIETIIQRKAKWILKRIQLLEVNDIGPIISGGKIKFFGRDYQVNIKFVEKERVFRITPEGNYFNFLISHEYNRPELLQMGLDDFYSRMAKEHLPERVKKWSVHTGLIPITLKFRKMKSRWGSCSAKNGINLNTMTVKLPWHLIDYLIVHELSHIAQKNHSRDFYAEMAKYLPNCKELDQELKRYIL